MVGDVVVNQSNEHLIAEQQRSLKRAHLRKRVQQPNDFCGESREQERAGKSKR
jgi:hypothetical protein